MKTQSKLLFILLLSAALLLTVAGTLSLSQETQALLSASQAWTNALAPGGDHRSG